MNVSKKKISRVIRFFNRSFAAVYGNRNPVPSYVHDLRIYCNRINAYLYLVKDKNSRLIKAHLEKIMAQTGAIRDQHIYETLIKRDKSLAAQLWNSKAQDRLSIIKSHRQILKLLKNSVGKSPDRSSKRIKKYSRKLLRELKKLPSHPRGKRLHRMRLKIKKLRYLYEVVDAPDKAVHKVSWVAQTNLGDLHDCQNALNRYHSEKEISKKVNKKLIASKKKLNARALKSLRRLEHVLTKF